MKCPVCVKEGLQSRVYGGDSCVSTCMGTQSYYDEKGRRHWHDPNSHFSAMSCSNRHKFGITSSSRCGVEGCTFGHDEIVRIFEVAPDPAKDAKETEHG